jgi:L-alanine-DL-glutamate epimerase-like enolase superfamily enzyme
MQCIAGIDTALWDLAARLAKQPLWKLLGGTSPTVRVYASGINPDGAAELALMRRAEGYNAFKLKVGFGLERDLANLHALRNALGNDAPLMVDANQGWSVQQALEAVPHLGEFRLRWLEEPVRADTPWPEWQRLAKASPVPLAGGENVAGFDGFEAALQAKVFATVQPDMAKWGGFTGCVPVARRIRASGATFCPHYLGGGIGLLASAHWLAAVGGDGMLEVDANENPLRTEACGALRNVREGTATLDDAPGLGFTPNLAHLRGLCGG